MKPGESKIGAELTPVKRALLALDEMQAKLDRVEGKAREPIAVIGLACRIPGGVTDASHFWKLLETGTDAIREIPADRWDINEYYDIDPNTPGKIATRWGGFLDRVDQFDPGFFGIAPREAISMDPQQRLLLETSWEALEIAGQSSEKLSGTKVGVYLGIAGNDYAYHLLEHADTALVDVYFASGVAHSIASGRLSYLLGLQGPSVSIDTACSSSLVAIHMACQALRVGDCGLALVGGVNAIVYPETMVALSHAHMLAPDGRCKTFDDAADGFVRGEGCGVILLKRLSDAQRDGDRILAVIRGSAVNQDGASSGLTAPNGPAQQAVIREALVNSGVQAQEVSYVEAHGTGTSLGDPIEVQALGEVLCAGRGKQEPLYVGSVKTNVGHLEAAAGITGVIKVVLSLQHREIPPHLHLKKKNAHVNWDQYAIEVPKERMSWPARNGKRIAGVSSFGFSGTNAHVILEEAPELKPEPEEKDRPVHALTISAKSAAALQEMVSRYREHFKANAGESLGDVAYTANVGRAHFAHRVAVVAESAEQAAERLQDAEGKQVRIGERPKIGFLFSGQGSQYVGMGRELYESSEVYRAAVDRCVKAVEGELERPLLEVMWGNNEKDEKDLGETQYTQPALYALEWGLAELWKSWGIEPSVVLGHSIGEYVAAAVAGVIGVEEGMKLVAVRGRLMQGLGAGGAMLSVRASVERVKQVMEKYAGQVSLGAVNGPESVVVSGWANEIGAIEEELRKQGVQVKRLAVSHGFHSPQMDGMLDEWERRVGMEKLSEPRVRMITNVSGQVARAGELTQAGYWVRQVREAVEFGKGMETAAGLGIRYFLEIGPQPVLIGMGQESVPGEGTKWSSSLRRGRGDWRQMLESAAALYEQGAEISWEGVDRGYARRKVELPTYAFQRERYWVERKKGGRKASGKKVHELLGERVRTALAEGQFEAVMSATEPGFVKDHRIGGEVVMPATGYLEMGLAAAKEVGGGERQELQEVELTEAMVLEEGEERIVQVVVEKGEGGEKRFRVYSAEGAGEEEATAKWTLHASGRIAGNKGSENASEDAAKTRESVEEIRKRCTAEQSGEEHYEWMRGRGAEFGPGFKGVRRIYRGDGEALGEIELPEELRAEAGKYQMHPALLDACLQVAAVVLESSEQANEDFIFLPIRIDTYELLGKSGEKLNSHARVRKSAKTDDENIVVDVEVFDASQAPLLNITGLHFKRVPRGVFERATQKSVADLLYELNWKEEVLAAGHSEKSAAGTWLIFDDEQGVGQLLSEALHDRGGKCVTVVPSDAHRKIDASRIGIRVDDPADYAALLAEVASAATGEFRGIISLWPLRQSALDEAETESSAIRQEIACRSTLHIAQALGTLESSARLWLCTRGSQPVGAMGIPPQLAQAPVWGLGKVIALEHPDSHCTMIDLDPASDSSEANRVVAEVLSGSREDQIALRDGARHVLRLKKRNASVAGFIQDEQPVQLTITERGTLDSFALLPAKRRAPGPGEVEIRVHASGINFRDVLGTLNLYPGEMGPLGSECSGEIVSVGPGVQEWKLGDEVVAVAPGSFASFVTTRSEIIVHKPRSISFEESASIPVAFITAHFTLNHLGKIRKGQRVLIHAAAGGVGLAAVQLAQKAGAEIFATAGSPEKRQFLDRLGVDHTLDSRTPDFAAEILRLTGGKGVDVVLNSLTGELIEKSFHVLAEGGTFLEIGKRDIWSHERVTALGKGIRYYIVDWGIEAKEDPNLIGSMFRELMAEFDRGALKPLPQTIFPLEKVADAFRFMAQARHTGKIILRHTQESARPNGQPEISIRPDSTYLITGGLNGLGFLVAQWLVQQGARHLLLAGRTPLGPEAARSIKQMEEAGARIRATQVDISTRRGMEALFSQAENMPPLKGIIHCAGVLDDGVLAKQEWARFQKVMAPKAGGAWGLHTQTHLMNLDFFVMFSSAASIFGSPGQGSYTAANTFLDGLAHYRRAQGLPGLSINWGAWTRVGMAARGRLVERMIAHGSGAFPPERGLRALGLLLGAAGQVAVLPVDWPIFLRRYERGAEPCLLEDFASLARSAEVQQSGPKPSELLEQIANASPARRRSLLFAQVENRAAKVLGLNFANKSEPNKPLREMGLDSLMAVELRNSLCAHLGCKLSATVLFDYPTLNLLTDYLNRQLFQKNGEIPEIASDNGEGGPTGGDLIGKIEQLSDEDVERMFHR